MYKIGFIGCGNMASAIIGGAVSSKFVEGENIRVFDVDTAKMDLLGKEYGVKICNSCEELAENCEFVVLAVKPQIFPTVLPQIKLCLNKNAVVVSIGAGKTLEYIGGFLNENTPIIRVMPNINAKVGASMSAVCKNVFANDKALDFVKGLCRSFGEVTEIPESQFALFGVIAGCSPAYSFMFIDSMAREAVKNGMKKDEALKICAQAVLGSAKMVLEDKENNPWALINSVCSPGGTTIEGVATLQNEGFDTAVMNAVKASLDKDKKL